MNNETTKCDCYFTMPVWAYIACLDDYRQKEKQSVADQKVVQVVKEVIVKVEVKDVD